MRRCVREEGKVERVQMDDDHRYGCWIGSMTEASTRAVNRPTREERRDRERAKQTYLQAQGSSR
jgi:hypothetical protein